jgi:hypothetical protein
VLSRYEWTGVNRYFMLAKEKRIAMGGGQQGNFAFALDADMKNGSSGPCHTFASPCLSGDTLFSCRLLELWGVVDTSFDSD